MRTLQRALGHGAAKPVLLAVCLLPLAGLVLGVLNNSLGANPAEALIRRTGDWTLRLLCLTLAVTPLRQLSGWAALARFRRLLGLTAFAYALLHFSAYAWLDMGLEWTDVLADVAKRPFILVGVSALALMLPLAATSFNRAIRALGAARWQALHRLVYLIGLLGLLHFYWMRSAKANYAEVHAYAAVLAVLLGWRLWRALRSRPRATS